MSVLELQNKLFPVPNRGNNISSDSRTKSVFYSTINDSSSEKVVSAQTKPKECKEHYSTTSLQNQPKWPIECQVIPEKIRHVDTVPAKCEPFYVINYAEPQPKPVGEEMGTLIYNYQPKLSVDYFCRASVGGCEDLQTFDTEPNTLKFESRFESGNLCKAIKVTNVYYELYLRPDMYTDGHTQWFYFRVQNTKESTVYRFSIVNLNKPDSLYRYGLRPLMYSEKEAQLNNTGWLRCGQNISYYKNNIAMTDDNNSLYTLTFTVKFRHSNDTVYIAQCYPYTYTNLQTYLRDIESRKFSSEFFTIRLLCRSLAGNNIYILTITSPENFLEEKPKKPVIMLSARVHPGETQSSYTMKGIIDFLTSDCSHAQELRDRFVFKLIPMLNPDGVIVGNSRCCLLGQDLNRQYRTVLREAFPQIYHTKVLLRRLIEENGIFLYCDIHGHSRRNNVFIYGCENRKANEKKLTEQVFPLMMHKNASDKFSFQNCKFKVQRQKEGTGRVFAWTLGIVNSYTLEISLGGSTMPSRQFTHFNPGDYEAIGRHFCETLLDFSDSSPAKEKLRASILQKLIDGGSKADEPINVPLTDYSSETDESENEGEGGRDTPPIKRRPSIKRQASITINKKKIKAGKILAKSERAALNMNKTSVEFFKYSQKLTKITDEAAKTGDGNNVVKGKEENIEERNEVKINKTNDNANKYYKKFRRRSKIMQEITALANEKAEANNIMKLSSMPKCTSLLFDDPFNPPDILSLKNAETSKLIDEREELTTQNAQITEDNSNEFDGMIRNYNFLQSSAVTELTDKFDALHLMPITRKLEAAPDSMTMEKYTNSFTFHDMTLSPMTMPKNVHSAEPINYPVPEGKSIAISLKTCSDYPGNTSFWKRNQYDFKGHRTHDPTVKSKGGLGNTMSAGGLHTQRRVSWTAGSETKQHTHAHYATSFSTAATVHTIKRKILKKSKSLGDKIDVQCQNKGTTLIGNLGPETQSNNNIGKKRKPKLKRSKSKK